MEILGIDIGGSGIKGAIVDTKTGELLSERQRIPTPKPGTPSAVADTVEELVKFFDYKGIAGCSFPTAVKNGKCLTAGNLSPEWVGVRIDKLFGDQLKKVDFVVGNDADLAGIAEMELGAGKGNQSKVFMVTVGTGIGTALFYKGMMIPNLELGRIFHTDGKIIELYASDFARKRDELSLKDWAKRFDFYLKHIDRVINPDLFIIGGGISKKYDKFRDHLTVNIPLKPAHFRNNAGIIGAAILASRQKGN